MAVCSGCQRISEERDTENGKDGAANMIIATNKSKNEEGVGSLNLEEQGLDTGTDRKSEGPDTVGEAALMILKMCDAAEEIVSKPVFPAIPDP